MARIPLLGGAYQSRSLIAAAQRCVNLYPEVNPPEGSPPVPVTHYPTPGLRIVTQSPTIGRVRASYRATNGDLYVVVNAPMQSIVYFVSDQFVWSALGTIPLANSPVIFSDNGLAIVIVDGTTVSYAIDMAPRTFGTISATNFYGGAWVTYLDTFFVLNRPGTAQFYISGSNVTYAMLVGGTAFDSLDIAAKTGSADDIVAVSAIHGELWLIGELTAEIWANTGAADFTFGRIQGAFCDHGCVAPYSLTQQDVYLFWLAQDRQGKAVIVRTEGYGVKRISTHAIEADIQSYATISDAIGYCHQIDGHAFYVLSFPDANKTWAYELATGQWHERASIDGNGKLSRHRGNCFAYAYGQSLVGDYQNGVLYAYDQNYYLDGNVPIPRVRTFPHLVNDGRRMQYNQFIADIEVGQTGGNMTTNPWIISLRWSDNRGASFGNAVTQSMGSGGQHLVTPQWQRLGYARDRVFELSWSAPVRTSLNGAWVTAKRCAT
jgi:hypothetical protein